MKLFKAERLRSRPCRECGTSIDSDWARCPYCDAAAPVSKGLRGWPLIAAAAFLWILALAIVRML